MSSVAESKRYFSTESPSEVTNLQWKIDNFKAMLDLVQPLKLARLRFDAGQTINVPTKWQFCFDTPNVAEGKLGIYLKLLESRKDDKGVVVGLKICVKNSNGTDFKRLQFQKPHDMKISGSRGFPDALGPLSKIPSDVFVKGCLVLDIRVELFSFGKTDGCVINTVDHRREKMARHHEKSKNLVVDNLQKLFENQNNSDFKIVVKDGKEFPVHKIILGSRSPVFRAMFESDMTEASSGTVQLDFSSEAMEVVLKFIYSGRVDDNWKEVVEELVDAAEQYSLTLLREFCDTMLVDAATPENSIDLLKLARKFELKNAEKDLMKYSSQNFVEVFNKAIILM